MRADPSPYRWPLTALRHPARPPLADQVLVITGASSGFGLSTARMAARSGAAVVLVARDGETLARVMDEIRAKGGRAAFHAADVAPLDEL